MSIPLVEQSTEEKLVTLVDVSWEQFKGIEAQLFDNHNVRLSYLSGMLEIMSPIGDSERAKIRNRVFGISTIENLRTLKGLPFRT